MPGRLEFDLGFGRAGRPRDESEPMRLLVFGDLQRRDNCRAAAAGESANRARGRRHARRRHEAPVASAEHADW